VRPLADQVPSADPDGRGASLAVTVVEPRMDIRGGEAAGAGWSLSAACALGAALAEESQRETWLNLVPPSWTQRRHRRRLWVDRAVKALLVLTCLGLSHTYLLARVYRLERQREAVLRQIEPIRETAVTLEAQKQQVRAVQAQMAGRTLPLQILLELHRKVPAGIFLSHLTMSPPDVTIRGTAGSLDLAFGFPMALEGSGLFKDVRPDGAQQVSRDRGNLIEYGCRCKVDAHAKVE
jgi:Tfp pilus assembly protein PilN